MGYWAHGADGTSFAIESDLLWGDSPADIFDGAVARIIGVFERDVGRKPTKEEIVAGLRFSLRGYEGEE